MILGRFFEIFCVIYAFKFSLTNFLHFVMLNCNDCCPWFVCLCVLGGGKSEGQVAKKCKKNENFSEIFFLSKSNNICKQGVLRSFEHVRGIFDLFCLSVSPGGSRLTVHRRLQIHKIGAD